MNINTPNRGRIGQAVANTFDKVLSSIGGVWSIEHHDDGTHGAITADSLSLDNDDLSGTYTGNVGSSLIPKTSALDLGATITRASAVQGDHPWRNLRLSGTITWVPFSDAGVAAGQTLTQSSGNFTWTLTSLTVAVAGGSLVLNSSANLNAPGGFTTASAMVATLGYFEHSRSVALGEWTTFTPTRTASAGTWTVGTLLTANYMLVGKTLFVSFYITGTSVSNAGVELRVAIPGGFVSAKDQWSLIHANDNGAGTVAGTLVVTAGGTILRCFATTAAGGFAIAATATDVKFVVAIEVQ